jgi:RNA polymerase sigma-70 factor (ECF subfamily)
VHNRSRGEQRFTALFEAHSRALLGYALRRVPAADAAEVVADTFLTAWRRLDDVPPGDNARFWLYAVARNNVANQRRRRGRGDRLVERLTAELREVVVPDHAATVGDSGVVRRAMDRLSSDDRELLRLVGWEGLRTAELAQVLGIPEVTARTRLFRARQRLRANLAPHGLATASNIGAAVDTSGMAGTRPSRTLGGLDDR